MVFVHSSQVSGGVESHAGSLDQTTLHLQLCGVRVDHLNMDRVLERVQARLVDPASSPLAIGSINVDHVHHFGDHRVTRPVRLGVNLEWQMVIDGAPVARRAAAVTGLPCRDCPELICCRTC